MTAGGLSRWTKRPQGAGRGLVRGVRWLLVGIACVLALLLLTAISNNSGIRVVASPSMTVREFSRKAASFGTSPRESALDGLRANLRGTRYEYAFPTHANTTAAGAASEKSGKTMRIEAIPRVKSGDISVREFFELSGGKMPLIVEGEVLHHLAARKSWDDFSALCGEGMTQTSVYRSNANAWAGLSDVKTMRMRDYLDDHIIRPMRGETRPEDLVYSSGAVGIPEFCPKLESWTPVPRFVAGGAMPLDPMHVQPGQPEMYIGPPGTKTELHMDAFLIPFWMSVYKGTKTFRVIPFEQIHDNPKLRALFLDEERSRWEREVRNASAAEPVSRELEIWDPDYEVFPELLEATVYEGDVNPGDWIYLPGGALHGVSNRGYSWGVSINSLLPPLLRNFAETCVKSGFKWNCLQYAKMISRESCGSGALDQGKDASVEDLMTCLGKGEQIRDLGAKIRRGESKEATLHELYGFGNYTDWCERNCASVRSRKRIYEEGILAKGWESLEAYYEAIGSEPDIAVDTPVEQVAYVCRQCKE